VENTGKFMCGIYKTGVSGYRCKRCVYGYSGQLDMLRVTLLG